MNFHSPHGSASVEPPTPITSAPHLHPRFFAIGSAGLGLVDELLARGFDAGQIIALNTCAQSLGRSAAGHKIHLPHGRKRGTHTAHQSEELLARVHGHCEGAETAFVIAGLGGRTGTDLAPLVARTAREAGLTTFAFVTLPFECEGSLRREKARAGLSALKAVADGVITLPGQKALKSMDENTSLLGAFKVSGQMLADVLRGVARMLAGGGLIDIHLPDLCGVLGGGRETESLFATAETAGPGRAAEVVEKLFAHPLLDNGAALAEAETVLVNVTGGSQLTLADVNRLMEHINRRCDGAHVIMGASIEEGLAERLAVTLLVLRRHEAGNAFSSLVESATTKSPVHGEHAEPHNRLRSTASGLSAHSRGGTGAAETTGENSAGAAGKSQPGANRVPKSAAKMRQAQLPLEIVNKGRFDKSEPTIYKGEDLDLPAYVRRGVVLN